MLQSCYPHPRDVLTEAVQHVSVVFRGGQFVRIRRDRDEFLVVRLRTQDAISIIDDPLPGTVSQVEIYRIPWTEIVAGRRLSSSLLKHRHGLIHLTSETVDGIDIHRRFQGAPAGRTDCIRLGPHLERHA